MKNNNVLVDTFYKTQDNLQIAIHTEYYKLIDKLSQIVEAAY
jgi:hypothetical protein